MTVAEATRLMTLRLCAIDAESGAHEARLLMAEVLGVDASALTVHRQMELTPQQLATLASFVERREKREPLQYILGEWSFMGLPVYVDRGVLIPRPETELMCEHALTLAKARGYKSALDLCTGSGCIAVSLAALGALSVTASDISEACVLTATENARRNGVPLTVRQSDLFESIGGEFDLIVSNPPYLTADELLSMQPELRYEPVSALDGGADGLDFYRRIAAGYRAHLKEGGALLLEIGASQAERVQALFPGAVLHYDYAHLPRFLVVGEDA